MLCSKIFSLILKHYWWYALRSSLQFSNIIDAVLEDLLFNFHGCKRLQVTGSDRWSKWPHVTASDCSFQNQNPAPIHALWKVWTMSPQHATATSSFTILSRLEAPKMPPRTKTHCFSMCQPKFEQEQKWGFEVVDVSILTNYLVFVRGRRIRKPN